MGFTRRIWVLLVGVVGLLLSQSPPLAEGIRLPLFVPFGPDQGDESLERGNDDSAVVDLSQVVPFLGENRGQIIVDTDGVLELREDENATLSAFIYAFSADVDTTGIGEVFYRETTDADVLQTASQLVNFAFPNVVMGSIDITSVFVATWFYVGYFDNHADRTNTFQCVVATDGVFSFVVLLYADDLIEWMTGDADGGVGGLGGDRADVGIIGDDPSNAYFLPASNTSDVLMLDSTSNIGMGGVWIFRVNDVGVILPEVDECATDLDNCDDNANCIDLVEGFECECRVGFTGDGTTCTMLASGSGSGSGSASASASASGDMQTPGSCVDAGFRECCILSCGIANVNGGTCFCDRACFFFGDCCSDILDVPCFPDIRVEFVSPTHTVDEDEGTVSVIVSVTGSFPSPPLPPLEAFVLLYSKDLTAETPLDYDGTVQIIEFSTSGMQVVSVTIVNDTLVENTESFRINITTTDDFITVDRDSTEVFILDDDSVSVAFQQSEYDAAEAQGTIEVCATLVPPASISQLERSVAVNLSTADGSATSSVPADYDSVSEMLVFSTDPVECTQINVISDGILEFTEEFFLSLSGSDPGVVIDSCCATVDILDTDFVQIGLAQTDFTVEEGGLATVCVELFNGSLERDVMATIEAAALDTASLSDFASGFYPLVITVANQPGPVCVNISTVDDSIHEGLFERFSLSLTAPSPQVTVDPSSGFVWIDDNDVVDLSITEDMYTVDEEDGAVMVCVELSGERERSVVVDLITVMSGTATESADYEQFQDALTFPMGSATTLCRNITINDDNIVENTESFSVEIDCGTCDNINVLRSSAAVNIIDDDMVIVQFVMDSDTVTESVGSVSVCLELIGTIERGVEVRVSTSSSSAVSPNDFIALVNAPISFSPPVSGPECISIGIVDDMVFESTESFMVQIAQFDSSVVMIGSPSTTEISITDNDVVDLSITEDMYTVDEEDGAVMVCVELSGERERSVVVDLITVMSGTATESADYELFQDALTFPMGSATTLCRNITINDDNIVENTESFSVEIDCGTCDNINVLRSSAVVNIIDDDMVIVQFVMDSNTVAESVGSVSVCLELIGTIERGVEVRVSTSSSSAVSPNDFTALVNALVSFSPPVSGPECINIDIVDDILFESTESFVVQIVQFDSSVVMIGSPSTTEISITDNDVVDLSITEDMYTVDEEDGAVMVCVELSGEIDTSVIVDLLTVMSGTATESTDYELFQDALTFSPGSATTLCRNITINDDNIVENTESFSVEIDCGTCDNINVLRSSAAVNIIDDDMVIIQFVMDSDTVAESVGSVSVCLELIGTIERGVEVRVSTSSSSAVSPNDFIALENVLVSFSPPPPGPLSLPVTGPECVNVDIVDDVVIESTESFFVQIAQFDSSVVMIGSRSMSEISITDNDIPVVDFVQDSYTTLENVSPLSVCLTLSGAVLERSVIVTISTSPGTALAVSDYVELSNFQVVFPSSIPSGQPASQECADIVIVDDGTPEDTEMFTVAIDNPQPDPILSAVPGALSSATITIQDNDDVQCTIGFVQPTYLIDEDSPNPISICLRLDGVTTSDVTFSFSTPNTPGTATPVDDYTPVSTILTFNPTSPGNLAFICPVVMIVDDGLVEMDEFFTVSIGQSECSITQSTATVSILDDERDEPIVQFQLSEYSVDEDDLQVMICVEVSPLPEPGQTAEATYTTTDGSALVGDDYGLTSGSVTFTSTSNPVFCFSIAIINDDIPEPLESFNVQLTQTMGGGTIVNSVPVIISDDDPESLINFEADSYTFDEDASQAEICAVVSPPPPAGLTVSAFYQTSNEDAIAGMDYETTMGQLDFTSMSPERLCFTVPILDDAILEQTESFSVQLTQSLLAGVISQTALVTILDDDQVESLINFEMAAYDVNEGDTSVEICAVASPPPAMGQVVSASYSTSDGTAVAGGDYSASAGQFVFTATTTQPQCFNIPITDDLVFEQTETFSVNLQQTVSAGVISLTVPVTIFDDDEVESLINFEMAAYDVNEGDTSVEICAVASPPPAMGQVVSASYSTSDGTAVAGGDYSASAGQFVFTATTTQPQCFNIPITDDFVFEQTETFSVNLQQTVSAGVISLTVPVTIFDNDEVESLINFEMAAYDVNEGDTSVEICVVASPPPAMGQVVSASYSTSDGSAVAGGDYSTSAGQFVFTATTTQPQCFNIPITDDLVFEQTETFSVNLQQTVSAGVISQTVPVTIFDNDEESVISFQLSQYSVNENDGQVQLCAVVTPDPAPGQTVTASYQTFDGTAFVGQDYMFASGVISFTSTTPEPQCFNVMIIDDGIFEPTETFDVTLSQTLSQRETFDSTVVTIFDNDQPSVDCGIDFLLPTYPANEDISLAVCIILTGPTNMDVTFTFETFNAAGNTATPSVDYQTTSVVLTFTPATGNAFLCPSVQLINDDIPEMDETFSVRISNSVCAITQGTATVIIDDDDSDESVIDFQSPEFSVDEDDQSVLICAVVSPPPSAGQSVSASYSTSDGTAIAGSDYSDTSGMLTFTSSSATQCFSVNIVDDSLVEPTESFVVTLMQSLSTGNNVVSAPVTIFDDDGVDDIFINFESLSATVEEDMLLVQVCAVTSSTPPAGQTVSASYTAQDGTAIAGLDYTLNPGVISFSQFTPQRQCIDIPIIDNDIEEPNEAFSLILTQVVSAGAVQQTVLITILDNDLATLAFEQPAGYFVVETDSSIEACLVVDSSTIDGPFSFSVNFATSDLDATAGIDYLAAGGTLFFSNGATRQCIVVTILPDFLNEPNEEFQITFSRVGSSIQGTFVGMTTVTIINDLTDEPIVLINDTPDVELETGGTTASVEVEFTVRNDVATVTCELSDLIEPMNCTSGFMFYSGLPADRQTPLILIIIARNSQGEVLANISRQVRLGFNLDCAVNFINAADDTVSVFQGPIVQLQWEEIGPVDFTECRLDQGSTTGTFVQCESPYFIPNLAPGDYSVKVRPNGSGCARRIRRTVFFTVI